jgi:hypothetical protein
VGEQRRRVPVQALEAHAPPGTARAGLRFRPPLWAVK